MAWSTGWLEKVCAAGLGVLPVLMALMVHLELPDLPDLQDLRDQQAQLDLTVQMVWTDKLAPMVMMA